MLDGVLDAAAIGVPDDHYGEVVGLFVIRQPSAAGQALSFDTLRAHVKQAMPQAAPAYVWFVDKYPSTASGKVIKKDLRARAQELIK